MPPAPRTILVIDDQIGEAGSLQQKAFLRNYEQLPYTFVFEDAKVGNSYEVRAAVAAVDREREVDLLLLDLKFGPDDVLLGFDILRRITARFPSLPVLVMSSADRDVEMLGRCLEDGAVGFIEKHKNPEYLRTAIERAIDLMHSHVLLGQSKPLRELRRQAARLSPYDQIPVLIVGERGTGKERVARYIHHSGPRSQSSFVAVNCAGVPESLFEAEFFGAEKGAYTGATSRRAGYLERAHGGTLFLDEVGTLPMAMQAKLLRVLQERSFFRLGATDGEVRSNFQLISATNDRPEQLLLSGRLREDFFDRVAAVTVQTPPLRSCLEDLPLLATHFLKAIVDQRKQIAPETLRRLQSHRWPGNVRELQRCIQEAIVRSEDEDWILPEHLPAAFQLSANRATYVLKTEAEPVERDAPGDWHRQRLLAELRIAVAAKAEIQAHKGTKWKAEFMRTVYPHCKAQNAKGFQDLIRRFTKGPWGEPRAYDDPDLGHLLKELEA